MNLTQLDELMDAVEMPVRPEALEAAWDLTELRDRARRVVLLVTMRARPGLEERLEQAARAFVAVMRSKPGSLGATLHQSPEDSRTLYMIERFANEDALARHMVSDYFADFRALQEAVLSEPVTAIFCERGR